jgi:putative ABC transport system ATP-binding protein
MSLGAIVAERLVLSGDRDALPGEVDLRAQAGEMIAIAGPSGSGKTTLLHTLGGLLAPAAGRLLIDGRPGVLWRESSVGIVFQNLCLIGLLTASETVALPLQARGLPRGEVAAAAAAALSGLGLADHERQLIVELSGGQRQRVALARVLAATPEVILADDPTSALDARWREVALAALADQARSGALVIIASADAEVVAACDRAVTLPGRG